MLITVPTTRLDSTLPGLPIHNSLPDGHHNNPHQAEIRQVQLHLLNLLGFAAHCQELFPVQSRETELTGHE